LTLAASGFGEHLVKIEGEKRRGGEREINSILPLSPAPSLPFF
jgi:hypothetical protein